MERWVRVAGFPNYEVSDKGNVRRAKDAPRVSGTRPGKRVVPVYNSSNYLVVALRKKGTTTTRYVHEMVCEAFMPKRFKAGMAVNHINRNRGDNSIENLQPIAAASNSGHGRLSDKTQKEIVDRAFGEGDSFDTIASDLGVLPGSVHLAVVERMRQVQQLWRKRKSATES